MAIPNADGPFDENGWAEGVVEALDPKACWNLLAPETSSRLDQARLAHQARRFFATELSLLTNKRYPADGWPMADRAAVRVQHAGLASDVRLVTVPANRAPHALSAGEAGARAIGGAGFDVLVKRTRRVWQIEATPVAGDERGPLLLAAILASLLLAPVVPPSGDSIFGVKGARSRLEQAGLRV